MRWIHLPARLPTRAHHQPSDWDTIVFSSVLICTTGCGNPTTSSTNQENRRKAICAHSEGRVLRPLSLRHNIHHQTAGQIQPVKSRFVYMYDLPACQIALPAPRAQRYLEGRTAQKCTADSVRKSSSASLELTDYSQVDTPDFRCTCVNFGAGMSPGWPHWSAPKLRGRAR